MKTKFTPSEEYGYSRYSWQPTLTEAVAQIEADASYPDVAHRWLAEFKKSCGFARGGIASILIDLCYRHNMKAGGEA